MQLAQETIEQEANQYFKMLYDNRISIKDLIEKMKQFKNSQVSQEKDVYACMILNLFDELKFL